MKLPLTTSGKISLQHFRELMVSHQSRVYSIAYRILQDRGTAEEVAQDVFLALYRNLERIESSEHLLGWLRRVSVQRATDACRRRSSRVDFAADEFHEDQWERVPADRNGSAFTPGSSQVEQLVATLPPMQRAVILLRYQEDMLPGEIAALLSMPLGTVKSNLQRALKLLRMKLERQRKEVLHG